MLTNKKIDSIIYDLKLRIMQNGIIIKDMTKLLTEKNNKYSERIDELEKQKIVIPPK